MNLLVFLSIFAFYLRMLSTIAIFSPHLDIPELVDSRLLFLLSAVAFTSSILLYTRIKLIAKKQILLNEQKNKYKRLLFSILPEKVARELSTTGHVEAKRHEEVTVLFTDFAGFTQYAENIRPMLLVRDLDEIFSMFDSIIINQNVEKIKTIGDSYMCASGLPEPSPTHAEDMVRVALEFLEFITIYRRIKKHNGVDFPDIRIGIHTGPVVAGIIGVSKTAYDIWGDTVNVAQRMEMNSESGKINITETLYHKIKHQFVCTKRGQTEVKGKGLMDMYFVEGPIENG